MVWCQLCTKKKKNKKKITLRCIVIGVCAVQFLHYIPLYRNIQHYAKNYVNYIKNKRTLIQPILFLLIIGKFRVRTNLVAIFGPFFSCSFGPILAASDGQVIALRYHFGNGPLTYDDFGPILAANEGKVRAAKCSP